MTNELIDRLDSVRSLVIPLFFVSTGELNDSCSSFRVEDMTRAHNDLFLTCWEHNLRWGGTLIEDWDERSIKRGVMRPFLKLAYAFGKHEIKEAIKVCREEYDTDICRIVAANRNGELRLEPITARAIFNLVKGSS